MITMKATYLIIPILALAAGSCGRESVPAAPAESSVSLQFEPSVAESPATRQVVFGDASGKMPDRSTFGLFICDHHAGSYTDGTNEYTEYNRKSTNIRAYRNGNQWQYTYFGYDSAPLLILSQKDGNHDGQTDNGADIFAYAPWNEDVTSPESVPFRIASATDVMYAAENADPSVNKDIDPATAGTLQSDGMRHLAVELTFRHALSLLVFDLTLKNSEYNHPMGNSTANPYTLDRITIKRKEGGHPLYVSGTMNAMLGGELSGLVPATDNELTVSGAALSNTTSSLGVYPDPNQPVPAKAYVLQVPTQTGEVYTNGDYTFEFQFSGQEFPVKFELQQSQIRHSDNTFGFRPGYRYTFHLKIDNYVHFEGVTIDTWETVAEPLYQTEI